MKTTAEIKAAYEEDKDVAHAIDEYTRLIQADPAASDEPYIERGLLYWKLGKRAEAINDYNEAISINPSSRAIQLKEATYSILDYYNKDLYNP